MEQKDRLKALHSSRPPFQRIATPLLVAIAPSSCVCDFIFFFKKRKRTLSFCLDHLIRSGESEEPCYVYFPPQGFFLIVTGLQTHFLETGWKKPFSLLDFFFLVALPLSVVPPFSFGWFASSLREEKSQIHRPLLLPPPLISNLIAVQKAVQSDSFIRLSFN